MLAGLPGGIVTPTTVNANVGVVGAAAGGGYGALCGRFGMACDALMAAEVVLADGRTVHVDAEQHPDLLWALRGGGTGYGIVTQASFATRSLPSLLSAEIEVPLEVAEDTLLLVQSLLDANPDALCLLPLFMRKEEGPPLLTLFFTWIGAEELGRQVLAELSSIDGASVVGGEAVAYRDTLDDGAIWPWGRAWAFDTRTFSQITAELARRLVDAASDMPLPGAVLFLHDFHGQAARVPQESAAFALRAPHFVAVIGAPWGTDDNDAGGRQRAWVARVRESLASLALPGGYPNFLAPWETDRVRDYFGESGATLAAIKARFDPHDLFRATVGRMLPIQAAPTGTA